MAIMNIVFGIIRGVILLIMSIFAANKARVPIHMRPAPGITYAQAEKKFNAAAVNAQHAAVETAAAEQALQGNRKSKKKRKRPRPHSGTPGEGYPPQTQQQRLEPPPDLLI